MADNTTSKWDFIVKAAHKLIGQAKEQLEYVPNTGRFSTPYIMTVKSDPEIFSYPYVFEIIIRYVDIDSQDKDKYDKRLMEAVVVDPVSWYKGSQSLRYGKVNSLRERLNEDSIWQDVCNIFWDIYNMLEEDEFIH